jgi:hypothetical protein
MTGMYSIQSETCKTSCGKSGSRQKENQVTVDRDSACASVHQFVFHFPVAKPAVACGRKKINPAFSAEHLLSNQVYQQRKNTGRSALPVAWRKNAENFLHEAVNGALASSELNRF